MNAMLHASARQLPFALARLGAFTKVSQIRVVKTVWVVLGSLAVVSGLAGCGKTHAKGTDHAPPLDQGEFLVTFAQAWCESRVGCCQAQGFDVDPDRCRTEITAAIASQLTVEPGVTEFDPQAAGDCVAAMPSWLRCGLEVDEAAPEACDRIVVGKVALGDACREDEDCAPSTKTNFRAFCSPDSTGGAGVCAERASDEEPAGTAAEGDACRESSACRRPLFCNGKSARCEARHEDGSPCDVDRECMSGACEQNICEDPQLDAATCQSALASG